MFLNPVDRDAIEPALRALAEAKIPVINFDAGVANMDLITAFVATNNYQAGVLCAESMMKDFPNGANVAVLNYPSNGACNGQCGLGAYAAVAVAGKDVKIYGVDGTQEAMDLIPGGIYRMTAAQSPRKIGVACYNCYKQYVKDGKCDPFTVEVDAYTIDASNVAQFSGKGYQ